MKRIIILLCFLIVVFLTTTVSAVLLKTERAMRLEISDLPGTYTMILYGARHSNDLESVVILDREGDGYTFEPNAQSFDYRKKTGVNGAYALKHGEGFISWHRSFLDTSIHKIIVDGQVAGYELRPLYDPLDYGEMDVLWISYTLSGKTITAHIKLKPDVERILEGDGDDHRRD